MKDKEKPEIINQDELPPETHWFCYYCGAYLGITSGGANWVSVLLVVKNKLVVV